VTAFTQNNLFQGQKRSDTEEFSASGYSRGLRAMGSYLRNHYSDLLVTVSKYSPSHLCTDIFL